MEAFMKWFWVIWLAITLLLFSSIARTQNIEYIGSIGLPYFPSDIYVQGEFAYIADTFYGLKIVNISDPSNPILVGECLAIHDSRSVFISENYAYVSDGFYGLRIISISDPAHPVLTGGFQTSDCTECLFIVGDYAYVGVAYYGLYIINISNPANPSLTGYFHTRNYAQSISVMNNYVFVAEQDSGIQIIDVSNPSEPTLAGSYQSWGSVSSLFILDNYAYLIFNSGLYNPHLNIIDVSDPTNPGVLGEYFLPDSSYARKVYVSANFAYIADGNSGLQIINVSDPNYPIFAGNYDTPRSASAVYVLGDHIYVADDSSLQILRFNSIGIGGEASLPKDISIAQNYPNPFNAQTIIQYTLPEQSMVSIDIFDILGRKIAMLAEGIKPEGEYQAIWDASRKSSGIYFYKIRVGDKAETKKMVLIK
jgi:hypothetical protein